MLTNPFEAGYFVLVPERKAVIVSPLSSAVVGTHISRLPRGKLQLISAETWRFSTIASETAPWFSVLLSVRFFGPAAPRPRVPSGHSRRRLREFANASQAPEAQRRYG